MVSEVVSWYDIIVLSIVEGVTEFLPVSSTGHMIIASKFLDLPENNDALNAFLIIVQGGAILAVVTAFWPLLMLWLKAWLALFQSKDNSSLNVGYRQQSLSVALSVIPFAIVGFIFKDFVKTLFSVKVVSLALITGGLIILLSEWFFKDDKARQRETSTYTFRDSFWVGLGQCAALWPGFSRSAATLIAARFRGFSRGSAAEVSFLVGFPTLFGTASYEAMKDFRVLDSSWFAYLGVGILISWAVAYLCVKGFVAFLKRYSMSAFAWYRIALGIGLLIWFRT